MLKRVYERVSDVFVDVDDGREAFNYLFHWNDKKGVGGVSLRVKDQQVYSYHFSSGVNKRASVIAVVDH